MITPSFIGRRNFLRQAAIVSLGFVALSRCTHSSGKNSFSRNSLVHDKSGYIDLPEGFSYRIISKTGDKMNDGLFVPARPDGMGVFEWENGNVLIIRNHENGNGSLQDGPFGGNNQLLHSIPSSKLYDSGKMNSPCNGGTTTLIYNELTQSIETQYLSLGGTMRNCSGGITPWNSWLSCEEDVSKANSTFEKDHGYLFEVPASSKIQLVDPVPLVEMGRFNREAVAVDPSTGIVYQTEDRGDGLIYRFIPNQKGNFRLGGKLQALAIVNRPSFDTRNWEDEKLKMNELMSVKWIDMENVLSPEDDLRYRGYDLGAARFARGEGIWYGNQEIYFAATNGGKNKFGQIFRYKPSPYEGTELESMQPGYLELFAESADKTVLHMCDNLTIAPWGDVLLCEDNGELNHIRGIKRNGEIYDLACNRSSNSEFAGVVFSPSGATLFVNLQDNGDTVAITGPWETFI